MKTPLHYLFPEVNARARWEQEREGGRERERDREREGEECFLNEMRPASEAESKLFNQYGFAETVAATAAACARPLA